MSLRNYIVPVSISIAIIATVLILASRDQTPSSISTYQAPLSRRPKRPAPGGYIVHLHPGHSLLRHSAVIGTDIEPHVSLTLSYFKDRVVYVGKNISTKLLSAIRADQGVDFVRHDSLLLLQPDIGVEEVVVE